ncbi:gamma-interferon-responsive lysosomal thiol protein [Lycium ferocissimum]|uniref:gamma-interferon-responsive lysosomal thiol protein n=1 Tax=Lycium ferocissimum TaxID=112874 RepID=UPI0028161CAB|nr:gamma-interferon-responsive lysosomal thiol protein [Lycium ferocissimum]
MVAIEGRQVLVILVALLSASSNCYESCAIGVSGKEKVKLDIYYESLCPSSAIFIVEHLPKLLDSGLIHIVDLKLFPYGNANVFNGTIYCQHGQLECLLNTVQACAIDAWPDLDEYLPFINCVENVVLESFVYRRKYPQWQTCFEKLDLEAKPVTDCYGSARGKELELLYANETQALQPPQTYVPWVVVDGQALYQDYENFISYICKAYKGTAVVPACNASVKVNEKGRKIKPFGVTKTTSSKLSTISSAITSWMKKLSALV